MLADIPAATLRYQRSRVEGATSWQMDAGASDPLDVDAGAGQGGFHFGGAQARGIVFHGEAVHGGRQAHTLDAVDGVRVGDGLEQGAGERLPQAKADLHLGHTLLQNSSVVIDGPRAAAEAGIGANGFGDPVLRARHSLAEAHAAQREASGNRR